MQWFWFSFQRGPLVTFDLPRRKHSVHWRGIYGVQMGGWFLGVVRSMDTPPAAGAVDPGGETQHEPSTRDDFTTCRFCSKWGPCPDHR
jgi:hypothetical protein